MKKGLLAALGCALLLGCGSSRAFRARFEGVDLDFDCEVQGLHLDASARVREIPPGTGPSDRMLGLDPGSETVVWLYHLEDDGTPFKDEDRAFSVAIALRRREPGRVVFPSDRASVVFFCDNWGRGFRSAEARAEGGWLVVREAGERALSGEFDLSLAGYKERTDRTREGLRVRLEGRFHAAR